MTVLPIEPLEPRKLLSFGPITFGAKYYDVGSETVVDAQGNTIVAGVFQQTVNFNPFGTPVNRTAVGPTDVYIAKYNPSGVLLWVGQIGGAKSDEELGDLPIDPTNAGNFVNRVGVQPDFLGEHANALALDASGNIFLGGTFYDTGDYNPTPNGVFNLTANPRYGLFDAYLIKINANGSFAWAKNFGGQFNDAINGIAVDPQGNAVVTGYFTRRADFDPGPGDFSKDVLGRDDIFVAKYTGAAGALVWVDTFGGESTTLPERDSGNGITVDASGNIFVTGTFADEADFDPGPGEFFLEADDRTDIFILQLAANGSSVMAKSFGGEDFDGGVKIAVRNGQIYTASYFATTIDCDPGPANVPITSVGDDRHTDLLISKFSSNGTALWAKPMGSDGYETIGGFAVASDGSVYTTGGFYNTADFDPGRRQFLLTSIEGDDDFEDPNDNDRDFSYDIYVSRLSTNGNFLGATRIGSSGDDYGAGLAVSPDASTVTVTGQFRNTVPFNSATGTVKRKSKGVQDAFLIQLSSELKLLQ